MDELDYYCSPDFQKYHNTDCAWCGSKDAKPLKGVDDIYLCETCLKDLHDSEMASIAPVV